MKTILTVLILMSFFLQTSISAQVPPLIKKTMDGKLKPSDFEEQETYMVNIDTISSNKLFSGEITWYNTKKDMIKKINSSLEFLQNQPIIFYKVIENNLVYLPRKIHYFAEIESYRIDWWFSESGSDKLETITLIKY